MQSFLIISKDKNQRDEYLQDFARKNAISQFDKHSIAPLENSFGIEDVRNLQKTAYLSPQNSKEKMLILENAEKLTPEAQNALLKILEEPPQNTYVFLSATTDNVFLPTILSRCKIIQLKQVEKSREVDTEKLQEQLTTLLKGGIGEKLFLAETVAKEKEKFGDWLTNMTLFLRDKMLEDVKNHTYPMLLEKLQDVGKLMQTTNVSLRMLLEHTFLSSFDEL